MLTRSRLWLCLRLGNLLYELSIIFDIWSARLHNKLPTDMYLYGTVEGAFCLKDLNYYDGKYETTHGCGVIGNDYEAQVFANLSDDDFFDIDGDVHIPDRIPRRLLID